MEKKTYIKPHMEVIDVTTETMFATSSIHIVGDKGIEQLGNYSRGDWDDLWD